MGESCRENGTRKLQGERRSKRKDWDERTLSVTRYYLAKRIVRINCRSFSAALKVPFTTVVRIGLVINALTFRAFPPGFTTGTYACLYVVTRY